MQVGENAVDQLSAGLEMEGRWLKMGVRNCVQYYGALVIFSSSGFQLAATSLQ